MCEMFRPHVLSKCTTTEHKALKDYVLDGECLLARSMGKKIK